MLDVPRHVAIIMDGNGRWALSRGLPRNAGHLKGAMAIKNVLRVSAKLGIKYITLFAFSSENFSRPTAEVNFLMKLFERFAKKHERTVINSKTRFRVIGDMSGLPETLQNILEKIVDETKAFDEFNLTVALNYSARNEVLHVINSIISHRNRDCTEKVTWDDFKKFLYTSDLPDPDLIIRTSGEQRLSNFLLLQSAYSELFFTKTFWPDFGEKELREAIDSYQHRERRFGNINERKSN